MLRIQLLAAAALAIAVAGCGGNSAGGGSTSSPSTTTRFDGATYPAGVHAADFTLPDLDGRPVSLGAQRGHVVALAFLPGDCRACLLVAEQIRGALDELESHPPAYANVRTILVSTEPALTRRRASALLAKASLLGHVATASLLGHVAKASLLGHVSYLTAGEARLRPVWRAYHVTSASAGRTAAEDAITVLLIDKRGLERVGFGIEQINPEGLSHDIRLLEAE